MAGNNHVKIKIDDTNSWEEGKAKNIIFIVTQDCQLACKYCYLIGKNNQGKMDFETARESIDYLFSDREYFHETSIILDFIGGEPFLEIELIDTICDYFKIKAYETDHPWFNSYRFNFSTNGLMYNAKRVQEFIGKNASHLSIQISIDGTKLPYDNDAYDIWKDYPIFQLGSYAQTTNNIRFPINPDVGRCTPASMCDALYYDKITGDNYAKPLPPVNPDCGTRIGYFTTNEQLIDSLPYRTNMQNILY